MKKQLTKDEFWEPLKEECPRGMKMFGEFIDKYKEENDWENLFNCGVAYDQESKPYVKYHDLPLAMQYGIFSEFVDGTGFSVAMHWNICTEQNIRLFFKTFENFLNIKPKRKIRQ